MTLIYCIDGNLFWAHLASAEVSFSSFVFPQNKMIGKNWEGRNLFCMESLKNLSSFIWKALGRLIAAISYSTASHVRHTNPNTHETYKIKLQNSHNENFELKHETFLGSPQLDQNMSNLHKSILNTSKYFSIGFA